MMSMLHELFGQLLMPLSAALWIFLIGALCRRLGQKKTGLWLICIAGMIAYFGSLVPVGEALLYPLETDYPPAKDSALPRRPAAIVVLGSGYVPRGGVPITGALAPVGLIRVVEAVRLARLVSPKWFVVSGGAPAGEVPSAKGYAVLARSLGVVSSSIIILDAARDTKEEASSVAALLHNRPFILVTSASHMPRAMWLMRRAGARPIAAPTGQQTGVPLGFPWLTVIPSARGLGMTEVALHEYLGLIAIRLGLE